MTSVAASRRFVSLSRMWLVPLVVAGLAQPSLLAQEPIAAPARKLNLTDCIQMGLESQPALTAARASLAAAETNHRGLERLIFARLLARDLPLRKQQACLGMQIAQANLFQAEWETRYAVTRNYFSVIHARQQAIVVQGLVDKLDRAAKTAKSLVDKGDPKLTVTQIDVDNLTVNRDFYRARTFEATVGIERATAALREAVGLHRGQSLEIADDNLPALVQDVNKETLISQAVAQRGEMAQAADALSIAEIEIQAQGKTFAPTAKTFAAGGDIHAKPIPQGYSNGEYRPGAIGPEMPTMMAGHRRDRMQRASDLTDRAGAVVVKTENLIVLEVEAAFLKWQEAAGKVKALETTPVQAQKIANNVQARFDNGNVSGEELLRARTLEDQARASLNEALYNHALALAALERVTAGGYRLP